MASTSAFAETEAEATPARRKLIEVALPLEAINAACKADKDRKTGTIRNLHKWFAPMPVPALRAMIFAALVDDPAAETERAQLLELVEELVASVVESPPKAVLERAKAEIRRCVGSEAPSVLDPFCGGGSTLIEAQRLGLESIGSDLNPIPVLMSKVLTEIPPQVAGRHPLRSSQESIDRACDRLEGFIEDVTHYAKRVYDEAYRTLLPYYPEGPNGDRIIAWWWARTVPSPDPRFQGAPTPLVNSWWLSKKKGETVFVDPIVDTQERVVTFEVKAGGQPQPGSKDRCLFSGAPITFPYIREQAKSGHLSTMMVATITEGNHGRQYFPADSAQASVAGSAKPTDPPTELLPGQALGFRVQGYGMTSWAELYTERQLLALETFAAMVATVPKWVVEDGGDERYAVAIASVLGLCVGKLAQHMSSLVRWLTRAGQSKATSAFGRADIAMTWDFAEVNPFGGSVGDWMQIVKTALRAFSFIDPSGPPARVTQQDARRAGAAMRGSALIVTDPPYFSAIGYADLSDYFYIWVRRALREVQPELFSTITAPKDGELIAAPERHESDDDAKQYFVSGFTETFSSLKQASRPDLPILIVYAYKEQDADDDSRVSAGWEAMLEAILLSGLSIVGTWPIHGAGSARMRGVAANALATYVLLVCRDRAVDAGRITRRDLTIEMRKALGPAVAALQASAIAPVDLAQAVIGPGMAVFSKYGSVLEADGSDMRVRDALLLINRVLAEIIDEQEADLDPPTRWAAAWFEQHQFDAGTFGEADALSRAKVSSVEGLERAGIVAAGAGRVRLLRRDELPANYAPERDRSPTVWEALQQLVKTLEEGGDSAAAALHARLGSNADTARELAYRLYVTCDRKGWSQEGLAYNSLVAAWPEIVRIAGRESGAAQTELEV